jgi:flagellar biosynthetic protein FlhB
MAEEQTSQERTEQPTQRRKEESRKKGQVPRSKELNTLLTLLIAGAALLVLGNDIGSGFMDLFASALSFDREVAFDTQMLPVRLMMVMVSATLILLPFFIVMIIGSFAGPLMMGGWSFSVSAMAFKLEKISPFKGIKRVFSAKGLVEMIKALIKFLIVSGAAYLVFNYFMSDIFLLGSQIPEQAFTKALSILQWSLVAISFSMIFIAVFDVPFELWNHNRQLKMTLQEVKDEMKETDGRPEVKARIRTLQREASQRRMMDAVPSADVVITNPTHFAVALKYDGAVGSAPRVLAKGRDLTAAKIRSVAIENDVAIFSAPPLARALYAYTEIDQEIPQNLFLAVAKVLAYVFQLRTGGGEYVPLPNDISVPEEYRDLYSEDELNGD